MMYDPRLERRLLAARIAGDYAFQGEFPAVPRSDAEIENSARILMPALISRLTDPDTHVRYQAIFSIAPFARMSETVVPILVGIIQSTNESPNMRNVSIYTLGEYGSKAMAATPALVDLTRARDNDDDLPELVVKVLAKISPEAAINAGVSFAILFASESRTKTEEIAVIHALAKSGKSAKDCVKCLILALDSGYPEIRHEAALALKKIAPEEAAKTGVP